MLNVYCRGALTGMLDMANGEPFYGFTYDFDYLRSDDAEHTSEESG